MLLAWVHLQVTSHHRPLPHKAHDYSRTYYVRTVAHRSSSRFETAGGWGDPLLSSLLEGDVSFFCKRNFISINWRRCSTSYINFHFHARSTSSCAAMGYLLVISNDDCDDECELCVYPRPEGRSIWWHGGCTGWIYCGRPTPNPIRVTKQPGSTHSKRTKLRGKRNERYVEIYGPETMKRPNDGQTLAN